MNDRPTDRRCGPGSRRGLEPFQDPRARRSSGTAFGVVIRAPGEALASHLGLGTGGSIVIQVLAESQAEAMGVLRNDIIVGINGVGVTGIDQAKAELRKIAADRAPLKLELIRKGARTELTR